MTEPVLDGPRIVPCIRQRVAAAVAQHVGVNREGKPARSPMRLIKPIDGVRGERAAALGREHEGAIRKLPP